jgi:hypothetical protein
MTMAAFKQNDNVKIKYSTMAGVVVGAALDETNFTIQYKVAYKDKFGEDQERYFDESDLEL